MLVYFRTRSLRYLISAICRYFNLTSLTVLSFFPLRNPEFKVRSNCKKYIRVVMKMQGCSHLMPDELTSLYSLAARLPSAVWDAIPFNCTALHCTSVYTTLLHSTPHDTSPTQPNPTHFNVLPQTRIFLSFLFHVLFKMIKYSSLRISIS